VPSGNLIVFYNSSVHDSGQNIERRLQSRRLLRQLSKPSLLMPDASMVYKLHCCKNVRPAYHTACWFREPLCKVARIFFRDLQSCCRCLGRAAVVRCSLALFLKHIRLLVEDLLCVWFKNTLTACWPELPVLVINVAILFVREPWS